MRVSYKWLKEYVDIPVSPGELAEKMTMTGVAVENVEYLGEGLENIVTARVASITPHPDADKLVVCQINTGTETLQVVTGAPNVAENKVVLLALVGGALPGIKIKKAKLRGVESNGMLCSAQELGLDPENFPEDQREGILLFDGDVALGVDVKEFLGLDDAILELDLTPNRADCLSMLGVAREVAAVLGTSFKMPQLNEDVQDATLEKDLGITIDNPELCGRYVGRLIHNIKIEPSPLWMQQRLQAAGVRPINNIVDVTNYVMLEFGQPLHAFDYNKVAEHRIIVRKGQEGEKMFTLDNVEREITGDMLVITDPAGPTAIAGVMGGLHSEITAETNTVLLESAYFNQASILRTSRKLGLRSEASMRYEKGVDINGCLPAANRACQLMKEIGAGEPAAGWVDNYPTPQENPVIKLRQDRIGLILGVEVPREQTREIIASLGFGIKDEGKDFLVEVPTRRGDITSEIDLIEEVARLFGYNKIPTTLPEGATTEGIKTVYQALVDKTLDVLTGCGLSEIITLSFMNPKTFDLINLPQEDSRRNAVTVQNPLSEEQRVLRTNMLHGILDILSRNVSRKNTDMGFFEIGNIFTPLAGEKLPRETLCLAAAVIGKTPVGWQGHQKEMDFYYLKGILENLFEEMNVARYDFMPEQEDAVFHPGRTAAVRINGEKIGVIGEIHPNVSENYRLNERTYVLQINLDALINGAGGLRTVKSLPKYPAVDRDIALVVENTVLAGDIIRTIETAGRPLLEKITLFDVYQGQQIKAGYKSMAFAFKFQAPDRTLTDEEVNAVYAKIQKSLQDQFQAELRA